MLLRLRPKLGKRRWFHRPVIKFLLKLQLCGAIFKVTGQAVLSKYYLCIIKNVYFVSFNPNLAICQSHSVRTNFRHIDETTRR